MGEGRQSWSSPLGRSWLSKDSQVSWCRKPLVVSELPPAASVKWGSSAGQNPTASLLPLSADPHPHG